MFRNWSKSDKVALVLGIVFVTYFAACIINVCSHNMLPENYNFPWWNIFQYLAK